MSNSSQLPLSFGGEPVRSPAEWLEKCRKAIKQAKKGGANTCILESQQKQAFNYFQSVGLV
jgi:hypothetical protein